MFKFCLVNQPAGLGDILYCQAIAAVYISRGFKIVWPVIDAYLEHVKYLSNPSIQFIPVSSDFLGKDIYLSDTCECIHTPLFVYIPLKYSAINPSAARYPLMLAKYAMCGFLPLAGQWFEFLHILRDPAAEDLAFTRLVGSHCHKYIFLNDTIGSPDGNMQVLDHISRNLNIDGSMRIVRNNYDDGINLFDYMRIISNASEIHTANTSLCYLIEYMCHNGLIENPLQRRFMYTRDLGNPLNHNFDYIRDVFSPSNWTFILPSDS